MCTCVEIFGLLRWLNDKESACQFRRHGFDPWIGKIPWRRKSQHALLVLPGKFHGQNGAWQAIVHEVAEELDMA